jgi:hypothetical protein
MIPLLCHKKQHLGRIMNRVLNCFQQAAKEVMANEGEPAKALKEATEVQGLINYYSFVDNKK